MLHENKEEIEYVILVAVDTETGGLSSYDADVSLDELAELADTAGAVVVGRLVQKLPHFNPATYIGSGKLDELRTLIYATNATGIITDDELSPSQMANLSKELDVKVMDRTMVILDIFAAHARTSEGKMQVELAQLEYRLSRLTGKGTSMSRLGGGIGTRGLGEKKLEHFLNRRKFEAASEGWYYSQSGRAVLVKYPNPGKDTTLTVSFEDFDLIGMADE